MSKWKVTLLHNGREIARKTFESYFAAKEWAEQAITTDLIDLEYDIKKVEVYIL